MKRKISILTLTFLFFASTTSLALVVHYCEMMKSASLGICEMHKEEVIKTSCCEEENEAEVYFTKANNQCCLTQLIDSSVKDNFVISKTELSGKIQLPLVMFINLTGNSSILSSNKFYRDTSPPPLTDNHLYLINSILLI
ncbi:MAG: hypothetical protein Q7S39_07750 [Ignavibacteria bacterium]|nr:hypothetical protein [Ignavibacteria bacterium]